MVLGTLIALLLVQLGGFMRLLLTTGLVLVWAMPVVVAVNIWRLDGRLRVRCLQLDADEARTSATTSTTTGSKIRRRASPSSRRVVVWGAIPFVAITVYAGLTQVPQELVEAASIDGSGALRGSSSDVTLPLLKPIFVILTSLSIIWDFQVFNQVWIMRDNEPDRLTTT